jgi:hypothetical protein
MSDDPGAQLETEQGPWIDSNGLEHEEGETVHTYDPTQPHFWIQLGHTDATNGNPHQTINPANYSTGVAPSWITGATFPAIYPGYQAAYDEGYNDGLYDNEMLGNEGGNTPVSGV